MSGDLGSSIIEAETFLRKFLQDYSSKRVHYILGNHDGLVEWVSKLNQIMESCGNLQVYESYFKCGSTLFLHGDIPIKNGGTSLKPRNLKSGERVYREPFHTLYDLITWTGLVYIYRRAVDANRKLPQIIDAVEREFGESVDRVVFGHSHHVLERRLGRYDIVNLGSSVVGYRQHRGVFEID